MGLVEKAYAWDAFNTLCATLDDRGWNYERDEEEYSVKFGVRTDDLNMEFLIIVDVEHQLVCLYSRLPFYMSEDKRGEGAIAICAVNYCLINGTFDYDLSNGKILFRMTQSFRDCEMGKDCIQYLLDCACSTVDRYNERLYALNKGWITLEDLLKQTAD